MSVKGLLGLAVAVWLGRWLAFELASYVGHKRLPPGPPPRESVRPPGWMPGPFDR